LDFLPPEFFKEAAREMITTISTRAATARAANEMFMVLSCFALSQFSGKLHPSKHKDFLGKQIGYFNSGFESNPVFLPTLVGSNCSHPSMYSSRNTLMHKAIKLFVSFTLVVAPSLGAEYSQGETQKESHSAAGSTNSSAKQILEKVDTLIALRLKEPG
jgi:hypothetical protein